MDDEMVLVSKVRGGDLLGVINALSNDRTLVNDIFCMAASFAQVSIVEDLMTETISLISLMKSFKGICKMPVQTWKKSKIEYIKILKMIDFYMSTNYPEPNHKRSLYNFLLTDFTGEFIGHRFQSFLEQDSSICEGDKNFKQREICIFKEVCNRIISDCDVSEQFFQKYFGSLIDSGFNCPDPSKVDQDVEQLVNNRLNSMPVKFSSFKAYQPKYSAQFESVMRQVTTDILGAIHALFYSATPEDEGSLDKKYPILYST